MEIKESKRYENKVIISRDRATGYSIISFNKEKISEVIEGLKEIKQ
jgi:spermidine/putrescine-binding protein